jgi:hypothetical protein
MGHDMERFLLINKPINTYGLYINPNRPEQEETSVTESVSTPQSGNSKVNVRWPIILTGCNGKVFGETRKVTESGLLIRSLEPLRINKPYRIVIQPPKGRSYSLKGRVVWSDLYGIDTENSVYGMNYCYVRMSDTARKALVSNIHDFYKPRLLKAV